MAERKIIKLVIYPAAKKAIDDCAERYHMKQQGVSSLVIEWFGRQPEEIQRVILGHYSPFTDNVIDMILEGMKVSATTLDGPNRGKLLARETERPGESEEERSSGA